MSIDYGQLHSYIEKFRLQKQYHIAFASLNSAISQCPEFSTNLLALAYDIAQEMPDKSRYAQYQSRFFDFGIKPGDKVLDMGSGHIPFPLATHLADISLSDHTIGRAGVPFKHVDGKPLYECSVEQTSFADKEFDFVYCSHVLEHVSNPEAACKELMRIGKRGYIECPTKGKDTLFNTAQGSNHLWSVECINGTLCFTEYSETDKKGVEAPIILDMNCAPQTRREKAVAALDILKADRLNTMILWDEVLPFEVRHQTPWPKSVRGPQEKTIQLPLSVQSNTSSSFKEHTSRFLYKVKKKILTKLIQCLES